jgi:hypothetical protein
MKNNFLSTQEVILTLTLLKLRPIRLKILLML